MDSSNSCEWASRTWRGRGSHCCNRASSHSRLDGLADRSRSFVWSACLPADTTESQRAAGAGDGGEVNRNVGGAKVVNARLSRCDSLAFTTLAPPTLRLCYFTPLT